MKKYIVSIALFLFSSALYAQNSVEDETDSLVSQEKFEELIEKYGKVDDSYSYKVLYNVAFAHFMLANDENTLKIMDLALKKDPTLPEPYYIIGLTYSYSDRYNEAIPFLEKAIDLETDSAKLSSSYLQLSMAYNKIDNFQLSLTANLKAMDYQPENAKAYVMISQLYYSEGEINTALMYLYKGRNSSSKDDREYKTILLNLSLLESLIGNYKEAEAGYKSILELYPEDYHPYVKLIQLYNKTEEYDAIAPLKKVLYDAHKANKIKDQHLQDMFCIDQFQVANKEVLVFERYEEGDKFGIYNKILFYVMNENQEVEYSIQTEYSPALRGDKEGKYFLCAFKGDQHLNYGIIYDDNTPYKTIKETVIEIIEAS